MQDDKVATSHVLLQCTLPSTGDGWLTTMRRYTQNIKGGTSKATECSPPYVHLQVRFSLKSIRLSVVNSTCTQSLGILLHRLPREHKGAKQVTKSLPNPTFLRKRLSITLYARSIGGEDIFRARDWWFRRMSVLILLSNGSKQAHPSSSVDLISECDLSSSRIAPTTLTQGPTR